MYLTLGKEHAVPKGTIIGIFDLDTSTQSYLTREFLSKAEKKGRVINTAEDIPNSFLLCCDGYESTVYLSQTSSKTMYRKI